MADLGNQKIKDTYQLVLQADASGNLQKLDGTSPSLTINSAFTYNVGTLVDGYVLKSNGSGVASWGALNADIYLSAATLNGTTLELDTTSGNTLSVDLSSLAGDSYWSANTDGSISPSGLTTSVGIGTTTPNSTLTVVGGVSATTFLSTNVINATTIQGSEFNSTSDTGYKINTNKSLWVDGGDTQVGNTSLGTDILGTSINLQTATTVVGNISGTTNLYIDDNMYSGTTNLLDIFASSGMSGTVTSVAISGTDGIDVDSGSPITDSGTITLGLSNVDATKIANGSVTNTEFQYINTLSSNAQTQLDAKLPLSGGTVTGALNVSGDTALGGDISLLDGKKLVLGSKAGGDANIKHSGTNLQIAETTGNIQITNYKTDGDIVLSTDNGSGGETPYITLDGGDVSTTIHTNITASGTMNVSGNISGTTDLYIDNKVGIGTSNPNKTLTVVGDISANTINFSLIDGGTF